MSKLIIKQDTEQLTVLDESETLNKENTSTATFTITYTDDSTEDVEVVIIPSTNSNGE